ncbi:MAG: acyltransferase family protein [Ktedonobacteraceae bacterium]
MNIFLMSMQQLYFWLQSRLQRIGQWFSYQLEDTKPKNSIAVLDGVRAIACLLVVFYHISLLTARTNIWAPNASAHPLFSTVALAGASGVTLFFVLSGFLLFRPYAKALLAESSWPSAKLFYLRRSFRIIPAYYVCLFVIILLSQQQYLQRIHWHELALFLTFFMDSTYRTNHQLNGPFWTLAVEWQYYLILPLIALAISWVVKRGPVKLRLWSLVFCLAGLIGWGLFTRYWGMYFATYPARSFLVPRSVLNTVLFFTYGTSGKYLEDFAIGMGISVCYVYTQNHAADHACNIMMRRLSHWLWQIGIIVLVFLALWHFDNIAYNTWPFLNKLARSGYWLNYFDWLSELCLAIGFGLCVTAILYWPMKVQRPFAWAPLRSIGLISYSMYMWHLPLILIFLNYVGKHLKGWNIAVVFGMYWGWVALIVVPFSFLMFMLVEKPWMRLGERFRQPIRKPAVEVRVSENLKL